MCGIIGILSDQPAAPRLVEALKRLEYRGYDSAGVALLEGGRLKRLRAPGKLANLDEKVREIRLKAGVGIGHTRWATHGQPNETNAHPHATGRVAIVHNGIIENFRELREAMEARGRKFETETDSRNHRPPDRRGSRQGPVAEGRHSGARSTSCAARSPSRCWSRARTTCSSAAAAARRW